MLEHEQSQTESASPIAPSPEHFRALCAELDEYQHLPELIPGATPSARPITGQSPEETLDASILAGLTLP